jgi:hypothetical protein
VQLKTTRGSSITDGPVQMLPQCSVGTVQPDFDILLCQIEAARSFFSVQAFDIAHQ